MPMCADIRVPRAHHGNVAACAKHFVGGGISEGGVNHATAEVSERTLRTVFLKPFKAAVDAGCMTIMAGAQRRRRHPDACQQMAAYRHPQDRVSASRGFVVSDMEDIDNLEAGKLHSVCVGSPDRP